jgi:antitoxin component YwqK of YwqJK toxin-antitoxin module
MYVFSIAQPLGRLAAALALTGVVLSGQSQAQSAKGKDSPSVVEPYKGAPIYLEEPSQVVVEPTIVSKQKINEQHGDGKVEREVARYSDNSFAAEGSFKEFYPNGKIFIEGQFRKGRQEGEWKYYFENGQLNRKMTFKDGKANGSWDVFHADGTLSAKRSFKDGLRDGTWISYDDTGKKMRSEEHYVAGEEDGTWKYWFPNGQLKQQVGFKIGKRNGKTLEWDESGKPVSESEYTDGKYNGKVTRWFANGRKIVFKYDNGRLISQTNE